MPVREFDCLRLGTAMRTPVDQTEIYRVLENPPAYDEPVGYVKGEKLRPPFLAVMAGRNARPPCRPSVGKHDISGFRVDVINSVLL
jgi:hypothetical protein